MTIQDMCVPEGTPSKRLRRLPNFQNQLRDYLHGKGSKIGNQIEVEAEVIAIVKSWGTITLLCMNEDKTYKVLTNPVLTMLRVRVGHRINVKGFEQTTIIKKEEEEEAKAVAEDIEMEYHSEQ
jgi:hypothetical protein